MTHRLGFGNRQLVAAQQGRQRWLVLGDLRPRHVQRREQLGQPVTAEERLFHLGGHALVVVKPVEKIFAGLEFARSPRQADHIANEAAKPFTGREGLAQRLEIMQSRVILFCVQRKTAISHFYPHTSSGG